MDYRAVAIRLSQEHPQTIAVVLARLNPQDSSEIVKLLPLSTQAELMNRIVRIDQLPDEVLEEIDKLIRSIMLNH